MATYVRGADTYLPDIKPFTPDYKFLSQILQTRTDKYDANFQATNDVYNKVVYADVSRGDSIEKRDQFAENIAPQIEKIAGMDLSLQQNADSAQSIFQPFYDDDLIVRDIVATSKFRDEMSRARRLEESPDLEVNDLAWATGMQGLQIKFDDFLNASPEDAMKMNLPKYVEDANLVKLTNEILGEMDPPLNVERDRYSEDGHLIITEKNGRIIQGAAYEYAQAALINNPKVQAAYAEDAFVKSRNFASLAMESGQYSSIPEAQMAWANQTIIRIEEKNKLLLDDAQSKAAKLINTNVSWSNYKQTTGVIPGSDEDKVINDNLSQAEAAQAAINRLKGIESVAKRPNSTVDGSLNKAYDLLMRQNIGRDLSLGATTFAQRDMTFKIKEAPSYLKQLDALYSSQLAIESDERQEQMNINADNRDYIKQSALQAEKFKLENPVDPLLSKFKKQTIIKSPVESVEFPVDKKGIPEERVDVIIENAKVAVETQDGISNDYASTILDIIQLQNPNGNTQWSADEDLPPNVKVGDIKGDGMYTIPMPTAADPDAMSKPGTISEIEDFLNLKESNGRLTYSDLITSYYNELVGTTDPTSMGYLNKENFTIKYPEVTLDAYNKIRNDIEGDNGLQTRQNLLNVATLEVNAQMKNTFDDSLPELLKRESNQRSASKSNWPTIYNEKLGIAYTNKQFYEVIKAGIESGEYTNPNLTGIDGTSDLKYLRHDRETRTAYVSGLQGNNAVTTFFYVGPNGERTSAKYSNGEKNLPWMAIDEAELRKEVTEIYKTQYDNLNTQLNSGNYSAANLRSTMQGNSEDTFGDANASAATEIRFNANVRTPESTIAAATTLDQLRLLQEDGQYGIIPGNTEQYSGDDYLEKDLLADKILNTITSDLQSWLNPKSSNSNKIEPVFDIKYFNRFGNSEEGNKTKAAIQLTLGEKYYASLKSGDDGRNVIDLLDQVKLTSKSFGDGTAVSPTITLVFDQSKDISPRSLEKSKYSSSVVLKMLSNKTQGKGELADYVIPNGLKNGASFRVTKGKRNKYNIFVTKNNYVPYRPAVGVEGEINYVAPSGGNYVQQRTTRELVLDFGVRDLDRQVSDLKLELSQAIMLDTANWKNDKEQYGEFLPTVK